MYISMSCVACFSLLSVSFSHKKVYMLKRWQCHTCVVYGFLDAFEVFPCRTLRAFPSHRKVTATKQLHILEAPTVLVVHLKRFSGLMGTKITRQIDFPVSAYIIHALSLLRQERTRPDRVDMYSGTVLFL